MEIKEGKPYRADLYIAYSDDDFAMSQIKAPYGKPFFKNYARVVIFSLLSDWDGWVGNSTAAKFAWLTRKYTPSNDKFPLGCADEMLAALSELPRDIKTVYIDIAEFTSEVLQILLRILHKNYGDVAVYCGTDCTKEIKYADSGRELFLWDELLGVRSVLGYPGHHTPTRKINLILIADYLPWLIGQAVDEFEPSRLQLCWCENATESYITDVRSMIGSQYSDSTGRHLFGSFNDIKRVLLSAAVEDMNNIIVSCSINNRYAIGAAMAAMEDEGIQLAHFNIV